MSRHHSNERLAPKCHQNNKQSSTDYHVNHIHVCETILTELLAIESPSTPSSSKLFTPLSWRPGASQHLCRPLSHASTPLPSVWSTPSAPLLWKILGNLQPTPPALRRSGSEKKGGEKETQFTLQRYENDMGTERAKVWEYVAIKIMAGGSKRELRREIDPVGKVREEQWKNKEFNSLLQKSGRGRRKLKMIAV